MARKWAKIVPGHLYGWKKESSDLARHRILNAAVKKDGYTTIIRRLNQLVNLTKDRGTKRVGKEDMEYLKKKFRK